MERPLGPWDKAWKMIDIYVGNYIMGKPYRGKSGKILKKTMGEAIWQMNDIYVNHIYI